MIVVQSSLEQSVAKPTIPQFTVNFINATYNVTTLNRYTGENTTQQIDNNSIEIIIRNQPFTPYYDSSSNSTILLYYNIRMKGHFDQNWTNLYASNDESGLPTASVNSEYTTFSYPSHSYSNSPDGYFLGDIFEQFPNNAQVDFQVEAMIGYVQGNATGNGVPYDWGVFSFIGQESGWSNTQTINVSYNSTPDNSSTIETNPTTPNQSANNTTGKFSLNWVEIAIVALLSIIAVLLVVNLMHERKGREVKKRRAITDLSSLYNR